jgi:hypothetical protein
MSVSTKLYAILQSIFNGELYPVVHPDPDGTEVADLYAIFLKVGGQSFNNIKNTDSLQRPRMQISIYGIDFDVVEAKELAVVAAMQTANIAANTAVKNKTNPLTTTGALPNSLIGTPVDGFEKDTKRFVKHLDYYCWVQ